MTKITQASPFYLKYPSIVLSWTRLTPFVILKEKFLKQLTEYVLFTDVLWQENQFKIGSWISTPSFTF
jgi:hypothetical protein